MHKSPCCGANQRASLILLVRVLPRPTNQPANHVHPGYLQRLQKLPNSPPSHVTLLPRFTGLSGTSMSRTWFLFRRVLRERTVWVQGCDWKKSLGVEGYVVVGEKHT